MWSYPTYLIPSFDDNYFLPVAIDLLDSLGFIDEKRMLECLIACVLRSVVVLEIAAHR